jgi:hypothetical protein
MQRKFYFSLILNVNDFSLTPPKMISTEIGAWKYLYTFHWKLRILNIVYMLTV